MATAVGLPAERNAPVFGARPGECMRCHTRLQPGQRPGTLMHEVTGTHRCPDISHSTCQVCRVDGLFQCSVSQCSVLLHPDCGTSCSCCGRICCPSHTIETPGGLMCPRCADSEGPPIQERV